MTDTATLLERPCFDQAWRDVTAARMEDYFDRLWPLFRSITGDGVRRTLDILSELIPLQRREVPSGTQVLDWRVPPEWIVRSARLVGPDGEIVIDVRDHNLHLLNYSAPFTGEVERSELEAHLYSLSEAPDAIPYVTSYYEPRWGFCLPHRQRLRLKDGTYRVEIDTEFRNDGSMTLSDVVLPGDTSEEVLLSTYTCHPSMANNELSGPLALSFLYSLLATLPRRRFSYRFVLGPETIGSIAYLASEGDHLRSHVVAGWVVTCCADRSPLTFKASRRGTTLADRAARAALRPWSDSRYLDFVPNGSDERQYCSPGFDLPVGVLMRSIPGEFPQYHTSLDDKNNISFAALTDTVEALFRFCWVIENNVTLRNLKPFGEPQLSRYGLMQGVGGQREERARQRALKWLLNLADGTNDLIEISERSKQSVEELVTVANQCLSAGLIARQEQLRIDL